MNLTRQNKTRNLYYMSCVMRKSAFCIFENKGAADQLLWFRYIDSTIPLLPRSETSSRWPSSGFSLTLSEPPKTDFLMTWLIIIFFGFLLVSSFFDLSLRLFTDMDTDAKKYMSRVVKKPAFCICENKDAEQLRGNRKADQRLCFRYTDSTIPLLS